MIRSIELADLDKVNLILKEFDDVKLTENSFKNHPFSRYIVYELNSEIIAVLNYSLKYDKIDIEYLVVLEKYRRKGIGTSLIDYLIQIGIDNKCINITLEVRKSNVCGINLYNKMLFKEVAIRKNYYNDEDGILLIRELVSNEK